MNELRNVIVIEQDVKFIETLKRQFLLTNQYELVKTISSYQTAIDDICKCQAEPDFLVISGTPYEENFFTIIMTMADVFPQCSIIVTLDKAQSNMEFRVREYHNVVGVVYKPYTTNELMEIFRVQPTKKGDMVMGQKEFENQRLDPFGIQIYKCTKCNKWIINILE